MSIRDHGPKPDNPFGFEMRDPAHDALHIDNEAAEGSREAGYELSDANFNGLIAFIGVLAASVAVFFVVCWALGKLMNHEIIKYDGPASTWAQIDGANLSPAQREVMELIVKGLDHGEIAETLGKTKEAIRRHLCDARAPSQAEAREPSEMRYRSARAST